VEYVVNPPSTPMNRNARVDPEKIPRDSLNPARNPMSRQPATLISSVSIGSVHPALSRPTQPPTA
jgi:hypothetical protein